jgi:predicted CXXCH cytochrome family protein
MRHIAVFIIALLLTPWSVAGSGHVGSARCVACHQAEAQAWRGSHHELAMAEATTDKVLGNFDNATFTAHGVTSRFYRKDGGYFVRTDGPDGQLRDYRIKYTFGWTPLQQYLIELSNGHVQVLGIAWDSRPAAAGGQRWFHLYPMERMDHRHPQHWTARSQTWNHQCAECHSTNLQKNYDLASDSYRTSWGEINVACEACHGPGSKHVAWAVEPAATRTAGDKGLTVALAATGAAGWAFDQADGKPRPLEPVTGSGQVEACARCHSRRGPIWHDDGGGRPLGNSHRLALLEERLYFSDGQIKDEAFEYGSFAQSRMHSAGVACSNCHDPHSLKLRAEGKALCTRCHLAARYDASAHHHHPMGSPGASCISCHMPQRVYMVNDWRADHSLRVPRPDLSVSLGTPNACSDCHAGQGSDWAARAVARWYPESRSRGPHFAEAFHAAATGKADGAARLLAVARDPKQPEMVRGSAVSRLAGLGATPPTPALQALLSDPQPLVRAASLRFLEVADAQTRFGQGWERLRDPERTVRLEAARVLAPLLRQRLSAAEREELVRGVADYEASLRVNADLPEAHLDQGALALSIGDGERAEQAYRTALRLDSRFAPAYVNLADLYRLQQRDREGEHLLRDGIDQVTFDADLRHTLGLLLVRQKRLGEALPWLREAAEAEAGNAHYSYAYALALRGSGDATAALRILRQALERHPGNREILLALTTISRDQKETVSARAYADELLERFPEDRQAKALRETLRER